MSDTAEVIPFDKRERNHVRGEAVCVDCKHTWQAVISEKDYQDADGWLECPACSTHKGRLKYPFSLGEKIWECNCGNRLFEVTPEFTYCPNCGSEVKF